MGTVADGGGQIDAAIGLLHARGGGKARRPFDPLQSWPMRCCKRATPDDCRIPSPQGTQNTSRTCPMRFASLPSAKRWPETGPGQAKLYEDRARPPAERSQALLGYADLCLTLGDIPKAQSLLPESSVAGSGFGGRRLPAWRHARDPQRTRRRPPRSRDYLRKPGLRPIEYVNLSYAAAEIAEDAGDYDEAFAHLRRCQEPERARPSTLQRKRQYSRRLRRCSPKPSSRRGENMATSALVPSSSSVCRGRERRSPSRSSRATPRRPQQANSGI